MRKILLLLTMAMTIVFTGCEKDKDEPEVNPREQFVGTYSLNVTSDVNITKGGTTTKLDLSASNKSISVALDESDNSKLKVSGYYGDLSATVSDNKLYIEKHTASTYVSGTFLSVQQTHEGATLTNGTLKWTTIVAIVGVGSSSGYGYGNTYNTAVKQ